MRVRRIRRTLVAVTGRDPATRRVLNGREGGREGGGPAGRLARCSG